MQGVDRNRAEIEIKVAEVFNKVNSAGISEYPSKRSKEANEQENGKKKCVSQFIGKGVCCLRLQIILGDFRQMNNAESEVYADA